jgi:hypothetical protein
VSNRTRTLLIAIVTCVWALNFTAPIFVKDYKPAPELNVAFMAILGILTSSYRRGDDNDGGNRDNQGNRSDREEIDR